MKDVKKLKYKDFSTKNPDTGIAQLDEHIEVIDALMDEIITILKYEDIIRNSPVRQFKGRFEYKFTT